MKPLTSVSPGSGQPPPPPLTRRRFLLTAAATVAAGRATTGTAPAAAAAAPSSVTLTARLFRVPGQSGALYLNITLRNTSSSNSGDTPVLLGGSAFDLSDFRLTVRDTRTGEILPRTACGDRLLTAPTVVFGNAALLLKPGEERRYQFHLNRLFDLSDTEQGTVTVARNVPVSQTPPAASQPGKARGGKKAEATAAAETVLLSAPSPLSFTRPKPATRTAPAAAAAAKTVLYLLSEYGPQGLEHGAVTRFLVAQNGSLSPAADDPLPVGKGVRAMVATPDSRFVYVSSQGGIAGFSVRRGDGALTPLSPATTSVDIKGATDLRMDPCGRFLWTDTGLFRIGRDGGLTRIKPEKEFPGAALTVLHPTGNLAFAASPDGAIVTYRVGDDGAVTERGKAPLPTVRGAAHPPRLHALVLSPDGNTLYTAFSRWVEPEKPDGDFIAAFGVLIGEDMPLRFSGSVNEHPLTGISAPRIQLSSSGKAVAVWSGFGGPLFLFSVGENGVLQPGGGGSGSPSPITGTVQVVHFSGPAALLFAVRDNFANIGGFLQSEKGMWEPLGHPLQISSYGAKALIETRVPAEDETAAPLLSLSGEAFRAGVDAIPIRTRSDSSSAAAAALPPPAAAALFRVTREDDGKLAGLTRYAAGAGGEARVSGSFPLDRLFDLSEPGLYSVTLAGPGATGPTPPDTKETENHKRKGKKPETAGAPDPAVAPTIRFRIVEPGAWGNYEYLRTLPSANRYANGPGEAEPGGNGNQ